jgi:predicted ATPase/DNA-binding CsgD family transcriptional regulator
MDIVGTSMNNLRERSIAEPLSDRETEILGLLAGGLSNREIAQELFLSLETIKWYNKHIYSKLGVGSRTQAVARARELGLFADPGESPVASLAPVRTNLPAQLTSFVGREREIAEVEDLLKTTRLVTLTGPPGIGKTRLGLQLADTVAGNYSDGVIFVGLASTTDPALVPKAIAHKLGVVEQPNQPLVESLERYFGNKSALLVLDNYEHVLEAAALVTDLLAASPRLTVLVTSREVLRLNGEHEYIVPPLTVPDTAHPGFVSDLFVYESMALFNHRARAASNHFRLTEENAPAVAAICLRLDGLPLAIELAAARIKLFSPQQMLERLESRLSLLTGGARDLPARQRTLRDSIDWSYNLLDEDEQRLFARLAVFTGGRTIGAVEAICTPGLPIDALDGLESLLNKSLLYQEEGPGGEPRFIMLETIHEYARERLAESGEELLIRNRHLDTFRGLVEEMEPGYRRHNQLILLERTKVEFGNLRAAFEWAMNSGNIEAAARMISSIDYYFQYKGNIVEGYRWFKRVMEEIDKIPKDHQVRFLLGVKRLAWIGDTHEQEMLLGRRALALARELGDRSNEAWLLADISNSFKLPDEYEAAVKMSKRALTIFRELDDMPGMALALNTLGELERLSGNYELAKEAYEETLAICRETGEIYRQSMNMANLAFVAYDEGEYERGKELAMSILKQRMEIGWIEWALIGLMVLAGPLGKLGEPEKAARLLGVQSAISGEMGIYYQPGDQPEVDKYIADVCTQLDEAAFETAWAEGQAMTLEQAVAYALGE